MLVVPGLLLLSVVSVAAQGAVDQKIEDAENLVLKLSKKSDVDTKYSRAVY